MNKSEVIMNPVRMKIVFALMDQTETGLTTFELLEKLDGVSQATLYRHMQILRKEGVIKVKNETKIKGTIEKYYTLNEDGFLIKPEEWNSVGIEKKIDSISFFQIALLNKYREYLEKHSKNDLSTFSVINLNLSDQSFSNFQGELQALLMKYYNESNNSDESKKERIVALTIIPE